LPKKRYTYACCKGKLIKNISTKTESSGGFFLKLFPDGKGEERAASADCKLGGFKHKIFKWQDRIVK
jgi:hypothetical protein